MLKLKNITAGYHKKPVIQNINIEFAPGKITTIIGPNGSGKSTLLKAAVDLCEIYEGEVSLDGYKRDKSVQKEFAKRISYLAQNHIGGAITVSRMVLHGRFPYLTYPRHYSKKDYEYCVAAMKRIGILSLKDRKVEELSGGQRQKVYLAMALAGEMEVYLFDEPTTYLDVKYQLEMLEMIKQLREQKKTIITVLHDLNFAMQISDDVIVMNEGNVLFSGTPAEVCESAIIDRVFQVKTKILLDDEGKKHLFFEGRNAI